MSPDLPPLPASPPAAKSPSQPAKPQTAPEPPLQTLPPAATAHKRPWLSLSHLLWAAALLCVAAGLTWLVWPRPKTVETSVIGRGLVRQDIVDEGRTRIHDVFVVAAPVSGDLQRIDVEPGDLIRAGQAVAAILPAAPIPLDARTAAQTGAGVTAAAAALQAAEANLALAQHSQQRMRLLFDKGYASPAALDTADSAADTARAAVAARRAELRQAQFAAATSVPRRGRATTIRSPVSGRVLQLHQQSEAVVLAGTPLLDIGNPAKLEVAAEFRSQDAVRIKIGNRAFIEGWGGAPIAAHVTRVEPYAHTKVSALGVEEQRVNVIARPDDPKAAPVLGHGYRVDLRVVVSERPQALRVPVEALVRKGAAWTVFRLENGKVNQVPVQVDDSGDQFRAVQAGLKSGDRIVVYPGDTLKPSDAVRTK